MFLHNYINSEDMSIEEAVSFIRISHVLPNASAHIVFSDTLMGLSTKPKQGTTDNYEKHASSVSNSNFIILCYTVMVIVTCIKNVLSPYSKKIKLHILAKIVKRSLVYEIILGLLILIFLCSIYFTLVEPNINSYADALWYSFAVVTTIGFGDVLVTTTLGRILSVILGISGIAVAAVFTSFIVNFYNEMNKKREEKTLQRLIKETKELEKLEEEKLEELEEQKKKEEEE